jgi:hypothetical protein
MVGVKLLKGSYKLLRLDMLFDELSDGVGRRGNDM